MKHAGKALRSGLILIGLSTVLVFALEMAVYFGRSAAPFWTDIAAALAAAWVLFTGFTLFFFRDPTARTPAQPGLIVAPGHGTVDVIDQQTENQFMGGPCHRVSIFLSVFNVHVQNAPIAGKVTCLVWTDGQFVNAMRTDSALYNENVLLGFESAEAPGEKVGARMIAGLIARRIVPFVAVGDRLERGERVSLIQFGSRCDLYFPLHYKVQVKLGDKVVGGETVMAAKS
jgi:phosphatidylserine decarboxylase